jgi:hypothetical protein
LKYAREFILASIFKEIYKVCRIVSEIFPASAFRYVCTDVSGNFPGNMTVCLASIFSLVTEYMQAHYSRLL